MIENIFTNGKESGMEEERKICSRSVLYFCVLFTVNPFIEHLVGAACESSPGGFDLDFNTWKMINRLKMMILLHLRQHTSICRWYCKLVHIKISEIYETIIIAHIHFVLCNHYPTRINTCMYINLSILSVDGDTYVFSSTEFDYKNHILYALVVSFGSTADT